MEEKMKILSMVEDGTITADEAAEWLDSLAKTEEEDIEIAYNGKLVVGRKIRIKVYDPSENRNFDIKLPIAMIKFALRLAGVFSKDLKQKVGDLRMEELARMAMDEIKNSGPETLVDIEDGDGTIVKISVL